MKISERKKLEIVLDHEDIVEALFEWIWEGEDICLDDWDQDGLEIVFTSIRKKPDGAGEELRAVITCSEDLEKDTKAVEAVVPVEPGMPENEIVKDGHVRKISVHAVGEAEDFGGSDFPDIQTPADDIGHHSV